MKNKMVKPYPCFQSQGTVKQNLTEHAYCLVIDNVFLRQATVTLHQGQGHRNEHDHNYLSCINLPSCQVVVMWFYVLRCQGNKHAKFECYSLNIFRDAVVTLNEGQYHRWTGKDYVDL